MEAAFGILGRTALRIDGKTNEGWGPPRERAVLAALLIHAGKLVPIETLMAWVWPEEQREPRNLAPTFHTYATRIRKSLQLVDSAATLVAEDGSYLLNVDRSEIDYYRFRKLMAIVRVLVRERKMSEAAEQALHAIRLWRGRPLDELRTDHARNWRQRVLADDWVPANTILIETLLESGEHEHALTRVDDLLVDYPSNLALVKARMKALYKLARFTDADVYYFDARRRLVGDSDVLAAEHLRQFHDSLMGTATSPAPADTYLAEKVLVPRQLPHDPPDFVGRQALINSLDDALTSSSGALRPGVVILDGLPGVGKSALAIHWAHRARHLFVDGDLYVNLRGYSASAKVASATVVDDFLVALGHPPESGLTSRAKDRLLTRLLGNRRTVVVLDNAHDSAQVQDLIPLLSGSVVVITSRQRLNLLSVATGARHIRVEPMGATEAAKLMSARLHGRRDVGTADRDRMIELCGGLPLVITVLAGHLATWPSTRISEFSRHLDLRQLIVEVGGEGTELANAETFFAWSYDKLAEPERRLFRLLGLHPSTTFSLALANASDRRSPAETQRSLGVLTGAHLVEQGETLGRYRVHDLLHEYAMLCAERHESPDACRSAEREMLNHYLVAATQAHRTLYPGYAVAPDIHTDDGVDAPTFPDAAQARSWLNAERTNIVAAIKYAAAHGHHDYAWRLGDTVATYFDRRGSYRNSRVVRQLAVESAAAAGDAEATASCQVGLGMVLMILGEHDVARECFSNGLRFAEETGSQRGQASALHQLARLAMARGDPISATGLYRRSLDVALKMDDDEALCWAHGRLGQALRIVEDYEPALTHLHQSQFHAQRIGDGSAHASAMAEIGLLYSNRGDYKTAVGYCEQALGIIDGLPIPDLAISIQIYLKLAEVNLAVDDAKSAAEHALQAVALAARSHDTTAEANGRELLGSAYFSDGDSDQALVTWRTAKDLYEATGNTLSVSRVQAKVDSAVGSVELPTARHEEPGAAAARRTAGPQASG